MKRKLEQPALLAPDLLSLILSDTHKLIENWSHRRKCDDLDLL